MARRPRKCCSISTAQSSQMRGHIRIRARAETEAVSRKISIEMRKRTQGKNAREPPRRILSRPNPADWVDDELMSFPEAASLFWPDGPLSVTSLRTAHRNGQLAVAEIAGKFLTTKRSIEEMTKACLRLRCAECKPQAQAKPARPKSPSPLRARIEALVGKPADEASEE